MLAVFMSTTGWVFWSFFIVLILTDILCLYTEDDVWQGWAVALTGGFLVFTYFGTDAFVQIKFEYLIVALAGYFVLGVGWALQKWVWFITAAKDALKIQFSEKTSGSTGTFKEYLKGKNPTAKEHKQLITTWMTLWPLSFTWWVLTWPREAFVWAYKHLTTTFDRISTRIWESA